MSRVFGSILLHQKRTHLIEQLLDAPAVAQGAFDGRHQLSRNIKTAATTVVGKGQEPIRVLFSAGASAAVGSDAGFVDPGQ